MRTNLKVFRVAHKLTQAEIAAKLGVSRQTYAYVERGERLGTQSFWDTLQQVFNVPDSEMYSLMKIDNDQNVSER